MQCRTVFHRNNCSIAVTIYQPSVDEDFSRFSFIKIGRGQIQRIAVDEFLVNQLV